MHNKDSKIYRNKEKNKMGNETVTKNLYQSVLMDIEVQIFYRIDYPLYRVIGADSTLNACNP